MFQVYCQVNVGTAGFLFLFLFQHVLFTQMGTMNGGNCSTLFPGGKWGEAPFCFKWMIDLPINWGMASTKMEGTSSENKAFTTDSVHIKWSFKWDELLFLRTGLSHATEPVVTLCPSSAGCAKNENIFLCVTGATDEKNIREKNI